MTLGNSAGLVTLALCAVVSACGNSDSGPTSPTSGYQGEWSGTTSQGRPINFTVSADQRVTAISVGYNFNSCSGVQTFANLNLEIGLPSNFPPPRAPTPTPGPGFGYGSGPPDGQNHTQVHGWFDSATRSSGVALFTEYPGCGSAVGIWSASKR